MMSNQTRITLCKLKNIFSPKKAYPLPKSLLTNSYDGSLLAITGNDWRKLKLSQLLQAGKFIKGVLALDDDAAILAHEQGIQYNFIEDYLHFSELRRAINEGLHFSRTWFIPYAGAYTINGVVWPQIDQACLSWFWREAFTAHAVSETLVKGGGSLLVVHHTPYKTPEYYYPSDTFGRIAKAVGGEVVHVLPRSLGMRFLPAKPPTLSSKHVALLKGAIVCALNPAEIQRNAEQISMLAERYPGQVIIIALGPYSEETFAGIPVLPIYCAIVPDEEKIFAAAWRDLQSYASQLPPALRSTVMQCLEYYHTCRWPMLLHWMKKLRNIFMTATPACVLGTDLDDAESQIPFIAARACGIPSLAWGHALAQPFYSWHPHFADKVMTQTKCGMLSATACEIPGERYIPVSGVARDDLYPSHPVQWPVRENKKELRILVLPWISFIQGISIIVGSVRAEASFLAKLASPPKDLAPFLCIRVKEHPAFQNRSPFLLSAVEHTGIAFPHQASLIPLLDEADVCISLGDTGCALLHAARRVPTFFLTEDGMNIGKIIAHVAWSQYPTRCENFDELWDGIRKILHNPELGKEILERQKMEFADSLESADSWLDVVGTTLSRGNML